MTTDSQMIEIDSIASNRLGLLWKQKMSFKLGFKCWKTVYLFSDRIVAGKLFHAFGPATANAHSPKFVLVRGT